MPGWFGELPSARAGLCRPRRSLSMSFFFFQAEDGIRDHCVTGVQTCALPILISDTTVILTHVPTNQARTSVTNEEGHYQFRFLPVGEYRLELERTGFSRYQQKIGRASCRESV